MTNLPAFNGMPTTVPRAMKSGNVTAIPKLIKKLNTVEKIRQCDCQ